MFFFINILKIGKKFWKIYQTSYYRLNDGFFNFVKARRDNKEKRLKCTENKFPLKFPRFPAKQAVNQAKSISCTGLPSSACVVDYAINGFIGVQISLSKGDALVF